MNLYREILQRPDAKRILQQMKDLVTINLRP